MRTLCLQPTLLPIVLVLKKNAHVMENAKNASSITTRKAKTPTVQDNHQTKGPEISHGGVAGICTQD